MVLCALTFVSFVFLEIELHGDLPVPRGQNLLWREPGSGAGRAGGSITRVVHQDCTGVPDVVDVDADPGPCPAEFQDLGDAEVELVDPIAVHRVRRQEGHERKLVAVEEARGRCQELVTRPEGARRKHEQVRLQRLSRVASERPAELDVDLRNQVRAKARDQL